MAKEFPKIKKKNKGKFTRWVKRNMKGSSTCDAADTVMAAKKGKYSDDVREMANYAKNFGCKTEGKGKGATAMKEGPVANKFIGELTKARKAGKNSFVVDGKTHKVKK
jgi:hypothetical protein